VRIVVAGDAHGNTMYINKLVSISSKESVDRIVQVGDFGYWEHIDNGKYLDEVSCIVQLHNVDIYWIDY